MIDIKTTGPMGADRKPARSRLGGAPFIAAATAAAAAAGCVGIAMIRVRQQEAPNRVPSSRLVYTSEGYGGYHSAPSRASVAATKARPVRPGAATPARPRIDPVAPALAAYSKGDFAATQTAAGRVIAKVTPSSSLESRRAAVRARDLVAFSKARAGDLAGARAEFAQVRADAARLPDHGKPEAPVPIGEAPPPTFEENAAYQHAVCTGALGDKAGAEAEYVAFMREYPDSPLLQAAIKRIARLHGGDIPKADEAVWSVAMNTARTHDLARQRDASMCGPECLAEVERRAGNPARVGALAAEMKTSERGTSLADLEAAARRHGFAGAQGVALTAKGLAEQRLPVIALVAPSIASHSTPGHYVLIDAVSASGSGGVRVWDPDGGGVGHGVSREISGTVWGHLWRGGFALALRQR